MEKTLEGNIDGEYVGIKATSDGYIATGHIQNDAVIVKYDISGNMVWKKTFAGTKEEVFTGLITSTDGYVVVGVTQSSDGDLMELNKGIFTGLIVKYDLNGNIVWKSSLTLLLF